MITNYSKKHSVGKLGPPRNGVCLPDGVWADYHSDKNGYNNFVLVEGNAMFWFGKSFNYDVTIPCKANGYWQDGIDIRFCAPGKGDVISFTQDSVG